jgi:hypothetical protein
MLASKRRELRSKTHQVGSKYAGPSLFLSSSRARQTSSFASRLGPPDQLHETWHQEMWQLKDAASHVAKSRYEWRMPVMLPNHDTSGIRLLYRDLNKWHHERGQDTTNA